MGWTHRLRGLVAATTLALGALTTPTQAQEDYPNRPIRVVIGFAAGSGADILCRFFTVKLAELAKQPVIVENKPGAISAIAAGVVLNAKPDGYTILLTGNSVLAAGKILVSAVDFDGVTDFTPVASFLETPFVLTVGAKSEVKTLAELTAWLKKLDRPARYAYTNPTSLIATELYKAKAGVKAEGVSFRTVPDVMPDLENGTIDFMIMDGTFSVAPIKAGRIRPLAVTTDRRVNALANVPTFQESGIEGYYFSPWWAAYLPKGAPPAVVAKLEGWLHQISQSDDARKFLDNMAAMSLADKSARVAERLKEDRVKWQELAKAANLQPQ